VAGALDRILGVGVREGSGIPAGLRREPRLVARVGGDDEAVRDLGLAVAEGDLDRRGTTGWDGDTTITIGARHWAIVASLVATAKLNGVEPQAWLDVLERVISGRTKAHEIDRLLPWAWQTRRLSAAVRA
jgi:hypothetical protein